MPATIVIGAQWGDEGKGKIVDVLSADAELVVRFGGGANAGHTIWVGGDKFVLHLIPSGILRPGCTNLIGGGCVIDVTSLLHEIHTLRGAGIAVEPERLLLADNAHVVTAWHRTLDQLSGAKIGTTGRGIGPAYADKARRIGIRLGDLRDGTFETNLRAQAEFHGAVAGAQFPGAQLPDFDEQFQILRAAGAELHDNVRDLVPVLVDARRRDRQMVFEGAQGVLLDIDHGTYPYVTSSNTTVAGALGGLGVHMTFQRRIGVVKAYSTRVGNGPFPTELHGEAGERLRHKGQEFGATTGRPRRCGWLDLVQLKRAFAMNEFTHVAVTKLDVLAGMGPVRVAVEERGDGSMRYVEFDGFDCDLSAARTLDDLPVSCRGLLDLLERELGATLAMLSTGPGRDDVLGAPASAVGDTPSAKFEIKPWTEPRVGSGADASLATHLAST